MYYLLTILLCSLDYQLRRKRKTCLLFYKLDGESPEKRKCGNTTGTCEAAAILDFHSISLPVGEGCAFPVAMATVQQRRSDPLPAQMLMTSKLWVEVHAVHG